MVGACPICFNSCPVTYHLADDRLTAITGVESDPVTKGRLCPKGQFQVQMYNSPDRLTQPLKRVGRRGEGRFQPIDWDTALDEVAERLQAVRDRYDARALAIYTGTRSSWLNKAGSAAMFAELFGTPNQEGTAPLCASAAAQAFRVTQGSAPGGNSFTETDLGCADYYLFVGDNMAETRPVYFGLIHDCRINNGARMVAIDPRQSATAAKADEWIGIRPGTDMALALGMMFHLQQCNLIDTTFLERCVAGWDRLCEFLREKRYTPQWAAAVTDIPEATIRRLAEELVQAERAVVFGGKGLNQHTNGFQTNRAFHMLCLLAGQWARPGAGFRLQVRQVLARARRALIGYGVLERHPTLQVLFCEAGATWVPYFLFRLDEHVAGRPRSETEELTINPSEYFKRQCTICSFEPAEALLRETVEWFGARNMGLTSDYPLWDSSGVSGVEMYIELYPDMEETQRERFFSRNVIDALNLQP